MRFARMMVPMILLATATAPAAAPATEPAAASEPTTRLTDLEPLADGSLRYQPPAGWEVSGKTPDRLKVSFASADGLGRIDMMVTPQNSLPDDSQAAKMAMIIGKAIRENAKKEKSDLIIPPRVEKDPRYFLKMRDRSRNGEDSKTFDRLQMYRLVGLNMVYVSARASADSPEHCEQVARDVDAVAETLLGGIQLLAHGARPVVFPHTELRITTPVDWTMTKGDEPNGLVVSYSDPKDGNRQIIVRARILPKDARGEANTAKRDALLERMIDAERRLPPFKLSGASPDEHPATVGGKAPPLRALAAKATRGEVTLDVVTRYFVVADLLVSVRSVAPEGDTTIGPLTDMLAASVKPVR
jgi:hypothetical protein